MRSVVSFQVLHDAQKTRKGVVSLLLPLVGPVADEMLQCLRYADLLCDPARLDLLHHVVMQLIFLYLVKLHRAEDDALTELRILAYKLLDIVELLRVLNRLFETLRSIYQQSFTTSLQSLSTNRFHHTSLCFLPTFLYKSLHRSNSALFRSS